VPYLLATSGLILYFLLLFIPHFTLCHSL
jgi:hypothetical protein